MAEGDFSLSDNTTSRILDRLDNLVTAVHDVDKRVGTSLSEMDKRLSNIETAFNILDLNKIANERIIKLEKDSSDQQKVVKDLEQKKIEFSTQLKIAYALITFAGSAVGSLILTLIKSYLDHK